MTEGKRTVLVVDDVPDDIVILEEILKREYQVKAVTNGEAALRVVRSDLPPDIILLDIMMPDMDGFEVCRKIKEENSGATIPIIFLTGKSKTADEKMGFELGAVDYIRKPVDPDIVKTRIKSHLEFKDQAVRSSEVRYRRLFETSSDGILVVDCATGTIVDANPALAKMLGLSQEYFLGKLISDVGMLKAIFDTEAAAPASGPRRRLPRGGQAIETEDGRRIFVESSSGSYAVNRREVMQLNIRDVSELVEAERERDANSLLLSHYLATSPTVTYSMRIKSGEALWQWASENIVGLLGYPLEETLARDWWLHNVHASDRLRALAGITKITGLGAFGQEYRFYRKDRSVVWLRDEMRLSSSDSGGAEVVGTLTDISDRKRVESELSLKSIALDSAANAIVITDRDSVIRWVNPAFEALTGYSRAEAQGKRPSQLVKSGEQGPDFYRSLWDTILSGKAWQGILRNRRKNGEKYSEEMTITPVFDEYRRVNGFVAIKNDVTDRELTREKLQHSLCEKGILLREIHHRINNNMQLIISLMNLSLQNSGALSPREFVEGISRRLVSIALVHEQFYNSEDMARIDFILYLHQLADGLCAMHPSFAGRISIIADIDGLLLDLENAIPAGLVTTELLTDAVLHSHPNDSERGNIAVAIADLSGTFELIVRSEGWDSRGEPKSGPAESLGRILVQTLAEQLQGRIEYRSANGGEAVFRFPLSR